MRQTFKDVTINGREFRIDLLPADIGSWAVHQMSSGRAASDFEVYQKLQGFILGRCSIYKGGEETRVPMKIYDSGRWLVPDLQYDLDTVNSLYMEALAFNFDPFFERAKAKSAEGTTPATNQ
jgi:hypothetical protein